MPKRPPQPAWMPAHEVRLSTLVQNVIGSGGHSHYTSEDAEHRRKWTFMDSLSKLPGHDDHNKLTKMCEEVGVNAIQELLKLMGLPPATARKGGAVTAGQCAVMLREIFRTLCNSTRSTGTTRAAATARTTGATSGGTV